MSDDETRYKKGEKIKGERIYVQARDIDDPKVRSYSSKDNIQWTKAKTSAMAKIEKPFRNLTKGGPHEVPIDD